MALDSREVRDEKSNESTSAAESETQYSTVLTPVAEIHTVGEEIQFLLCASLCTVLQYMQAFAESKLL
jgi:hypothetical protein